jgi:antitoxin (DNA-binding transcriptional repressor) of toxin-antitoxin stability system
VKFVTVRDLRGSPRQVWKKLAEERELVLTSNGKPIAILTSISEDSLEETLSALRRARALKAVRKIQEASRHRQKKLSLKEINAVIAEVRRERRARNSS